MFGGLLWLAYAPVKERKDVGNDDIADNDVTILCPAIDYSKERSHETFRVC
jgi:hypothetical protein